MNCIRTEVAREPTLRCWYAVSEIDWRLGTCNVLAPRQRLQALVPTMNAGAAVARMATQMFGTLVKPEHIIEETLVRTTSTLEQDEQFLQQLSERVKEGGHTLPRDYQSFIQDPLSVWVEDTFGITEREGSLVRTTPKSISGEKGAAKELSKLTGQPVEQCVEAIQQALLAGYACEPHPETGAPPFAFRLHQFISKGDTMYASLEPESLPDAARTAVRTR